MTRANAEIAAEELASLLGSRWEYRVWENNGWHYCAFNKYMFVFPSRTKGKYFAMLSNKLGKSTCPTFWHDKNSYDTPIDAVYAQMKVAGDFVLKHLEIVLEMAAELGGI